MSLFDEIIRRDTRKRGTYIVETILAEGLSLGHDVGDEFLFVHVVGELAATLAIEGLELEAGGVRDEVESLLLAKG